MGYKPTTWVDGETPVNAERLNNIEQGIFNLSEFHSAGGQNQLLSDMVATAEDNAYLERVSDGHFYKLHTEASNMMDVWIVDAKGQTVKGPATTAGSTFIKCPKYLCIDFKDTSATFHMYFYNFVNGAYESRWDIVNTTTDGQKNRLDVAAVRSEFGAVIEAPAGVFMQVGNFTGEVDIYGWDGVPFGMPLSADVCFPTSNGAGTLQADGRFGFTVPGDAQIIVSKGDTLLRRINGYKDNSPTSLFYAENKEDSIKFYKLPAGYDYFRVFAYTYENGQIGGKTKTGDIFSLVSVAVSTEAEAPSGGALRVLENCKKINSIKWTPVSNLYTRNSASSFKAGVEYNGLPYGSNWRLAHYIGWHVSPHTFINAANDSESIFFKEKLWSSGNSAPYYGVVCSVFASMCAGLPYPMATGGHFYDPNAYSYFTNKPPIGTMFDDLGALVSSGHVVIPERVDHMENSVAISAYESIVPVSQRTTRYSNVPDDVDLLGGHTASAGDHYYDKYGWAVYNYLANPDLSASFNNEGEPKNRKVPYLGMTAGDLTVIGGSARPYKGDKSVYTSAEKKVTGKDDNGDCVYADTGVPINIKNTAATQLILRHETGSIKNIPVNGRTQIDLVAEKALSGDGIYYVSTDVDDVEESFEYITVTPITYTMVNGVPKLSSKDFWYAVFQMRGDARFDKNRPVAQLPADDYSYLVKNGAVVNKIIGAFGKGTYGAYAIPVTEV